MMIFKHAAQTFVADLGVWWRARPRFSWRMRPQIYWTGTMVCSNSTMQAVLMDEEPKVRERI